MANDTERLIVSLEARIRDFEKNMQKAAGTAATNFNKIERSSQRAARRMEAETTTAAARVNAQMSKLTAGAGAFGKNFALGIVAPIGGLLTLRAAIAGTQAALKQFGDVADKSAAAGLDSEFFQGIAYQAKLSGVEIGAVADALASFQKNAGLAAEGKGKMVATLRALNPELLRNIQLATSQEQRVRLVADAIAGAKDQAQAAAIASAAFGDAGVKLVAAFQGGGEAIDRTLAKAKEMGVIVDRDVIAHADELGDKWDTVASIIDVKVKTALVGLAPQMIWLVDKAAQFANYMSDQLSGTKPMNVPNWGGQAGQHLGDVLRGQSFPETALSGGPGSGGAQYLFGDMGSIFNDATTAAVERARADAASTTSNLGVSPSTFDFRKWLDPKKVDEVASGLGNVAKSAYDTTTAIGTTANAVDAMGERFAAAEDLAHSFASTFIGDLRQGKSVTESLSDAFGNLAEELLQMAADQAIKSLFSALAGSFGGATGGTWGNGLWGSAIFGGARAGGGPVDAGKAYLVGEKRPEVFVPRTSGTILPNASGGPTSVNISYAPVIHGSGMSRKELGSVLAAERVRFARDFPALYHDAARRAKI